MTSAVAVAPVESATPRTVRLGAFVRAHRGQFVLGALYLVLSSVASGAIPQLLRGASNALAAGRAHPAMELAGAIAVVAAVGAAARVASRLAIFNGGREIEYELRAKMLAHLHTLGPSFFARMPPGEIMSRATNDLTQVRLLVGFGALNLVNTLTAYAVNIPLMVYRSPLLTAASLLPFVALVLVTRRFTHSLFGRSRATQGALGEMSDRAQQSLAGIRVVRAYGITAAEEQAFDRLSNRALEANLALARLRGGLMPIFGMGAAVATLVVLWLGSRLVVQGRLTVGDILAFQGHLALVSWPTIALGYMLSVIQRGRASFERVAEILVAEPDIADRDATALDEVRGDVEVRGLTYAIQGREVLSDVSFAVAAGGSLAIVGRTGSGKSTLASLLARMLPTPAGSVFLDGRDITTLPLAQLRAAVNLAQQEAFLFSTTIARNIAFAERDPDAPEAYERARRAAGEAQLLGEAESMPEGLDTIVGERGVQLSGGQKQRVALARALLAAPNVLVLDDPLSAVDARTEVAILDAIERAAAGRTLVLVTHRVAAASRCAQIVVLDEGRVVERGTHAALVAGRGLYARLAERQALEAELEALR